MPRQLAVRRNAGSPSRQRAGAAHARHPPGDCHSSRCGGKPAQTVVPARGHEELCQQVVVCERCCERVHLPPRLRKRCMKLRSAGSPQPELAAVGVQPDLKQDCVGARRRPQRVDDQHALVIQDGSVLVEIGEGFKQVGVTRLKDASVFHPEVQDAADCGGPVGPRRSQRGHGQYWARGPVGRQRLPSRDAARGGRRQLLALRTGGDDVAARQVEHAPDDTSSNGPPLPGRCRAQRRRSVERRSNGRRAAQAPHGCSTPRLPPTPAPAGLAALLSTAGVGSRAPGAGPISVCELLLESRPVVSGRSSAAWLPQAPVGCRRCAGDGAASCGSAVAAEPAESVPGVAGSACVGQA